MKVSLINVHGDNFGDFLNARAAKYFVEKHLHGEVRNVLPAGGSSRWRELPEVGPICGADGPPQGIYDPREVAFHLLRIPHGDCPYADDWTGLATCLRGSDAIVSVPCGANVGPYRDSAFLAPLVVAAHYGRARAILGGTVHASGSWKYDALARAVLRGVDLSVRDDLSTDFLRSTRRPALGPADVSFSTARRMGDEARTERKDVLCVVVGDTLSWHPDSAVLEPADIRDSVSAKMLRDAVSFAGEHGLRVLLVPHSPLAEERERLEALRGSLACPAQVELGDSVVTVEDYVATLASARIVLSLRYHGVVSALANGVPVVTVAYEAKSISLMKRAGLNHLCQTARQYSSEGTQNKLALAFASKPLHFDEFVQKFELDIQQMQIALASMVLRRARSAR